MSDHSLSPSLCLFVSPASLFHKHTHTCYTWRLSISLPCGSGCDIAVPRNRLGSLLNWYECHIGLFKNSDEFGKKCSRAQLHREECLCYNNSGLLHHLEQSEQTSLWRQLKHELKHYSVGETGLILYVLFSAKVNFSVCNEILVYYLMDR